ncbi:hypothetical protein FOL46_009950 [Perkinsus olseni]|uniref:Uncharacterized protein n=1 Tax=Perkinsus olseni TaxID=32597 RepID=A0A7J6MJJ5_PEROL|nr:hypothetical protein FOL46_009950 [Perkinsus olseni]
MMPYIARCVRRGIRWSWVISLTTASVVPVRLGRWSLPEATRGQTWPMKYLSPEVLGALERRGGALWKRKCRMCLDVMDTCPLGDLCPSERVRVRRSANRSAKARSQRTPSIVPPRERQTPQPSPPPSRGDNSSSRGSDVNVDHSVHDDVPEDGRDDSDGNGHILQSEDGGPSEPERMLRRQLHHVDSTPNVGGEGLGETAAQVTTATAVIQSTTHEEGEEQSSTPATLRRQLHHLESMPNDGDEGLGETRSHAAAAAAAAAAVVVENTDNEELDEQPSTSPALRRQLHHLESMAT